MVFNLNKQSCCKTQRQSKRSRLYASDNGGKIVSLDSKDSKSVFIIKEHVSLNSYQNMFHHGDFLSVPYFQYPNYFCKIVQINVHIDPTEVIEYIQKTFTSQ